MPTRSTIDFDGSSDTLYRHTKRPEWGLALPAWESADKMAFKFEDGRVRIIKKSYAHMIQPADVDDAVEERIGTQLRKAAVAKPVSRSTMKEAYPFSDQIRIFRAQYPDGFQGEGWAEEFRGGDGRRLKRHRQPAIEAAAEQLGTKELAGLLDGDPGAIVDRAVAVLKPTDLAQSGDVAALDAVEGEERATVGRAIHDLLWGEDAFLDRFGRWVDVLESAVDVDLRWRFATALPALVHPAEHPCVRRSLFRKQAASLAPRGNYSKKPRRSSYASYADLAKLVRDRLVEEGLEPRDLLDVHDFIYQTLRPAAAEQLEQLD